MASSHCQAATSPITASSHRIPPPILPRGGGVFVEHDILPAGPPFTGTWARRDGGRFRATIWSGFPGEGGPGSPGVAVRVRLVGRLEHRTISGTYTATVFDATGARLESNTGKFSGHPIDA